MLALVVTALLWSSRRIRCTTPQQTHGPTAALIGGRIGHAFITSATKTDVVEEYDPATDTFGALKAKMPTPRRGGGRATYNNKSYVAGGEIATPQVVGAFRAIEVFDPATNSWSAFPSMPLPRHGVAGAVIGT
jgi:hypothetical protein